MVEEWGGVKTVWKSLDSSCKHSVSIEEHLEYVCVCVCVCVCVRGELLAITWLFHYTHKGPTGHNIFPSRFKSPHVLNANDIKHTANISFL